MAIFPFLTWSNGPIHDPKRLDWNEANPILWAPQTGQAARSVGWRPVGQASQVSYWKGGLEKICQLVIYHHKYKSAPCDFPGKITPTSAPNPTKKLWRMGGFFQTHNIFTTKLPPSSCVVAGQVWSGTLRGSTKVLKSPLPSKQQFQNGPNLLPTHPHRKNPPDPVFYGAWKSSHFANFMVAESNADVFWIQKSDSRISDFGKRPKTNDQTGWPKVPDDLVLQTLFSWDLVDWAQFHATFWQPHLFWGPIPAKKKITTKRASYMPFHA